MNLIVVTDIGRDPDDFFALCYLHSVPGVNIKAITVSPGDEDQISIVKFFCSQVKLDIPVGSDKLRTGKKSSGGMHYAILNKYGHPLESKADGYSQDIIKQTFDQYPDCEVFACGPLSGLAKYLKTAQSSISNITVQGGFLPYSLYRNPSAVLDKFESKETVPTFNLNGDPDAAIEVINSPLILNRRFVSKNVCHTIVYDSKIHAAVKVGFCYRNRASKLFIEAMDLYLSSHPDKKFHDPTAAVCHLHPEIAVWIKGKLYRDKGGWGTKPCHNGDKVIADIDRQKLWQHIACMD